MAGLLDFGDTEEEKHQNKGLLAALAGLGILGANGPNTAPGQAIGAGTLSGVNAFAQQQRLAQQQQMQNARMQMAQSRMVPQSVREYEYAKSQGYQGGFEDYRNQVMGRNEVPSSVREWEYYNSLPQADQPRYLTMKRSMNPMNLGDRFAIPNPAMPGQEMASFQKGIPPEQTPEIKGAQAQASAAGQVQGNTQATAAVNLPQTIAQGQNTISLVDSLVNHPGMSAVVGMPESVSGITNSLIGAPIPGTKEADFRARLDQLRGQQFLQAFNDLRGGGQITEAEGAKATDAISRMMKTNQSEKEFRQAADDFKSIISAGVERAKKKAGVNPAPSGASGGWSIQKVE